MSKLILFFQRSQFFFLLLCFQSCLYEYREDAWSKMNTEGVFFVYQRRADPRFGFIILNRHNSTNLLEPVTSEFDFKFEGNFLLYKNKVRFFSLRQITVAYSLFLKCFYVSVGFQSPRDLVRRGGQLPRCLRSDAKAHCGAGKR